jgi:hypothetical protein
LAHLHLLSHLAVEMRRPIQCLGLLEAVFGFLPLPACLLQLPAKGQRIAFHDIVDEVKHIRDTPALQSLLRELEESLGPSTAQGTHGRSEGGKPLVDERLPGRIAAIFHRFFPQNVPGGKVQEDQ